MTTRFVPRWVLESDDPADQDPILTVAEVRQAQADGDANRLARAKTLLVRPDSGEVVPVGVASLDYKLATGWKEPEPEVPVEPEVQVVYVEKIVVERDRPVGRWAAEAVLCLLAFGIALVLPRCQ